MAKNIGLIKLKGSLGGMSFYEDGGKNIVKMANGPDKEKIMTDPAYRRTRENMVEFGGAAKVGKAFRSGFGEVAKTMGERYLSSRVTGLMKRINSFGSGKRGERSFEFSNYKDLLKKFEFNRTATFGTTFFAPYTSLSFNAERNNVDWVIPSFSTDSYVRHPEGTTHFKLVLALSSLSDYTFNNSLDGFEPIEADFNSLRALVMSDAIEIGTVTGADINLSANLGSGIVLPATVIAIAAVGIIFYQEINSQLYELASGNGMRIEAVS